jgi:hypothetical protein
MVGILERFEFVYLLWFLLDSLCPWEGSLTAPGSSKESLDFHRDLLTRGFCGQKLDWF